MKVGDTDTQTQAYKFAGGMKSSKLQDPHFLYYIFIIIIICSLVFHIVIIVIVITSCDNLKQIKQYCLFFVELSSQLVAHALFTSDWKLAFFYKSGSPYPGPQGALGNTTTCTSTALQSPVFAHAPHRYCVTTICYAPIFELIIFCPRTTLMLWYFTAHTEQPFPMR